MYSSHREWLSNHTEEWQRKHQNPRRIPSTQSPVQETPQTSRTSSNSALYRVRYQSHSLVSTAIHRHSRASHSTCNRLYIVCIHVDLVPNLPASLLLLNHECMVPTEYIVSPNELDPYFLVVVFRWYKPPDRNSIAVSKQQTSTSSGDDFQPRWNIAQIAF